MELRLFVLLVVATTSVTAKKTAADWAKLNEKDLEESWKSGDEETELKTEHDAYEEMLTRRKAQSGGGLTMEMLQNGNLKPDKVAQAMAHGQSNAGMAMIFAALAKTQPGGKEWTEADETKLAGQFTALLQTGGLKVSAYRVESRKLLVTMQTGWYGADVKDFLLSRPEVMKVTWDSIDYRNPDVEQDPEDDEPPRATKAAAPSQKKKKRKTKSSGGAAGASSSSKKTKDELGL
mmetsp:Transcript_32363/g.103189  ORF Transcript_32363/g.103189 Transcript_32363/m.103189 type:complete len:234 (-) Transcript_32363:1059-1760(-)